MAVEKGNHEVVDEEITLSRFLWERVTERLAGVTAL